MTDHEILRAALTRVEVACQQNVTVAADDLRKLLDEIEALREEVAFQESGWHPDDD